MNKQEIQQLKSYINKLKLVGLDISLDAESVLENGGDRAKVIVGIRKSRIEVLKIPDGIVEVERNGATDFTPDSSAINEALKVVKCADSVRKLGNSLFDGCERLSEVELGGTQVIGDYCFCGCNSLSRIDLRNVTKIGYCSFEFSGLKELKIPNSVLTIDTYAFSNSNIKKIDLSEMNRDIVMESEVFSECSKLETIVFGENIDIVDRMFSENKALKEINLKKGTERIGYQAFEDCENLEKVDLSETDIHYIHREAFKYCKNIREVILPECYIAEKGIEIAKRDIKQIFGGSKILNRVHVKGSKITEIEL